MTFPSLHIPEHLYFVTATVCGSKHIFSEEPYAEIVLNSLSWLQDHNRMNLYAYVLMPSHLHTILKPIGLTIGQLLQNFGSFTAHDILKRLRHENQTDLLQFFHQHRRNVHQQHSIWQDIQAKNIYSREFLRQKLEYIHNNPIAKDWQLVKGRADYRYSSACYYDHGVIPIIPVDDVRDWL